MFNDLENLTGGPTHVQVKIPFKARGLCAHGIKLTSSTVSKEPTRGRTAEIATVSSPYCQP